MSYGKLYGVGVGPGNPKLMTLLAVETISNCPVIAVPASGRDSAVSYRIAAGAVEGIDEKPCIDIETPMTKDRDVLERSYWEAADKIIAKLKAGLDVAYLTLGDPTIYATYIYIHRLVKERGMRRRSSAESLHSALRRQSWATAFVTDRNSFTSYLQATT